MATARALTEPARALRQDQQQARALAERAGGDRLRQLLKRAQQDLERRLRQAEGLRGPGEGSFTATQLRAVLEQVRLALKPLQQGTGELVVGQARGAAEKRAQEVLRYLERAEAKFTGVARPLAIRTAAVIDQAVSGTESTALRRLMTDPAHPARPGILDRYGEAVVGSFERELQVGVITGAPWAELREQITEQSPFLQAAPAHWAERIVRTELMYAQNRSSWETVRAANEDLGDVVKILAATFDSRTAADSYAVHGQIRRPEEAFDTWYGPMHHPPARPNDREVVVPHRVSWPIPPELEPKSDGEVAARWALEGRKGSPPKRPKLSTVDRKVFGQVPAPMARPEDLPAPLPQPAPAEPPPAPPAGAPVVPEAGMLLPPDLPPAPVGQVGQVQPAAPPPPRRFRSEDARARYAVEQVLGAPEVAEGRVRHPLRTTAQEPVLVSAGVDQLLPEELEEVQRWAPQIRQAAAQGRARPTRVRIDQVLALGDSVEREQVLGAIEAARQGLPRTTILVRRGGRLLAPPMATQDLAAAAWGGRRTVDVHVIDLDKEVPWRAPKPPPRPAPAGEIPLDRVHGSYTEHVVRHGARITSELGKQGTEDKVQKVFGGPAVAVNRLEEVWGNPAAGYSVRTRQVNVQRWRDAVQLEGEIALEGVGSVGNFARTFIRHPDGSLEVHHDIFWIDKEEHQGAGLGDGMMRQAIAAYQELGAAEITVDAAKVGRYQWARVGYNWGDREAAERVPMLRDYLVKHGVERGRAQEIAEGACPRAWRVADLDVDGITVRLKGKGGEMEDMKLGKAFLLEHHGWSGQLVLDDPEHETIKRARWKLEEEPKLKAAAKAKPGA